MGGCNCSWANKDSISEMIAEPQLPPDNDENENENINEKEKDNEIIREKGKKEKEKEKQSDCTSIQSNFNSFNILEKTIKNKEEEKPKLIEKLSKIGNFQEKNISDILDEKNHEANKIDLPKEITKEMPSCIELPPILLENGEIYGGGWNLQGEKEGYGINIDKENNVYKGLWKNNNYGDYGCFIQNNGNYYKGKLINGKAKGKGEMLIKNKLKYIGDFDNELPNGEGTMENFEDETNYDGHIINGIKEGFGTLKFKDGTKYEGQFKDDKYEGKGKIIYADETQYEGEFKNNLKDGVGVFIWPDGKKYEGKYKKDARNGKGKLILGENKFYEGNWVNDQPHGKGSYNINGEILSGIFRYGKIIFTDNKV